MSDREKDNPSHPTPPSPDEIQKEIETFMRDKFGKNIQIVAQPFGFDGVSDSNETIEEPEEVEERPEFDLDFDYSPRDIKNYLDKYVIKQDEAKKALAIAVCDHYNHVRECHEADMDPDIELDDDNYSKQNVIMLGPTGVGKTYLVKVIAKLIGVPFVKADATRFTEMGYVGSNVDDLVRDLVHMASDNIELAQYGIIYFDEADKIAGSSEHGGKDVSGRGVQHALLKLMEETEIDLRSGNDVASQMQAFMDFQRSGKVSKKVINTKHILFIVSGAFHGLDDIIRKRLRTGAIGLKSPKSKDKLKSEKDIFKYANTKDFIDFGLEPEFIGRLPVRLSCQALSIDDLYGILKESKGSIIYQYIRAFSAYGIEVFFKDEALREIAEYAFEESTGARALMTVCEKIFRDFKFELPSTDIKSFVVTKDLVDDPKKELSKIMADPYYSRRMVFEEKVRESERRFFDEHNIIVKLNDDAMGEYFELYKDSGRNVEAMTAELFQGFIHGFKIIEQNNGTMEFILEKEAITDPSNYFELMIKNSYKK